MSETIPLASYLFTRLRQLGIGSVHGVPGDFNLELLDYIPLASLLWVGSVNELNAGYAADGYARIKGLGALVTTFGVGELSAINAIAGAYAERSPVVHIVGTPSRDTQEKRVRVHHTFNDGNFTRFAEMYERVTVAQTCLDDANCAAEEVDRVLRECLVKSRPVYIGVPVDLVGVQISRARLEISIKIPETVETPATTEAISQVLERIYAAKNPVILFDGECRALGITKDVHSLIESTEWPTWTTSYGRGLIDESLPNFQGVYKGVFDDEATQDFFSKADLVLVFGPHFSTTNSYASSAVPKTDARIIFTDTSIEIGSTILRDVPARHVASLLRERLDVSKLTPYKTSPLEGLTWHSEPTHTFVKVDKNEAITHAKLWTLISGSNFIRPGDIVMGETGTSGYGVREMKTPANVRIFTPVTWLSIGYMLPAAQGAALAQRELHSQANGAANSSESRTILFIGDGSLQMTVQEISSIIRHNLNVIIIVLNNDGYTIERAIHGLKEGYNDVARWKYLDAPTFFGGAEDTYTATARTWGELERVLGVERLLDGTGLRMVELFLDKEDVPAGPLQMLMDRERERTMKG
ncbi:thiamine pyrophosphate enzyme [Setomelanomma holmii]|uniref:Pyruvate decarboxylase n=1 Tax=Setomelanomma holmii TaxID=210430 RepID=A0A9P4H0S4_9PLEO|nr:thiamine pyrophosphate enzyme [Setomelanomma holmii]